MTRTRNAKRQSVRVAGVCVVALLTAAASTSVARGNGSDDLAKAPNAAQPELLGTKSLTHKPSSSAGAARTAALADAVAQAACSAVSIAPGSSPAGGYLPLSLFGIPPIAGVTDDSVTSFNVPAYSYDAHTYTQVQVSSNGYVQAGASSTNSLNNQNFPNPDDPDSTLAALWTDLNPAVAGAVRIGTLTDGTDTWTVVDWEGVSEFSQPARTHSFQIWIGINSDTNPGEDISYAYGAQGGNGDGGFLTVGAENMDGTSGGVTYYNGTGTLPSNGTQLRIVSSGAPFASFDATPTSGPAPLHVEFDATTSTDDGTISSYDWDFGDTGTGTGVTTSHDYAAGVHTARLTVTDDGGRTCSTTQSIEVTSPFSVNDVSVNEAAGTATFAVTRAGGPAASVDVSATAGSANTPADFTAVPATLNFGPGETTQTYTVTIKQDLLDEINENYTVQLSNPVNGSLGDSTGLGTIVDDDAAAKISVNDANIVEGNAGTKNLKFKVWLNHASGKSVKVTLHTADGSARAPSDYASKTVTLTFTPGQTAKNPTVAIRGDTIREPNETFFVLLNNPVNSTIADPNASGGIINDD